MTTDEPESGESAPEEAVLQHASEELAQVQARIGVLFRQAEVRSRAGRYLRALLAPVERKNGSLICCNMACSSRAWCRISSNKRGAI